MEIQSLLQVPIHIVMLMVIIALAVRYQQLVDKYEDLISACAHKQTVLDVGRPTAKENWEESFQTDDYPGNGLGRDTEKIQEMQKYKMDQLGSAPTANEGIHQCSDSNAQISSSLFDPLYAVFQTDEDLISLNDVSMDERQGNAIEVTTTFLDQSSNTKQMVSHHTSVDWTEIKSSYDHVEDASTSVTNVVHPSKLDAKSTIATPHNSLNPVIREKSSELLNWFEEISLTATSTFDLESDEHDLSEESSEFTHDESSISAVISQSAEPFFKFETDSSRFHSDSVTFDQENSSGDFESFDSTVSEYVEITAFQDSFDLLDEDQKEEDNAIVHSPPLGIDGFSVSSPDSVNQIIMTGTSMWCQSHSSDLPSCYARNLCYNTAEKDFVILTGAKKTSQELYKNVSSINLSSVPEHNARLMRPVMMPAQHLRRFSVAIIDKPSLLMSRFKPDNIMHVLHDDILPLYHTLYSMETFHTDDHPFDVLLAFTDEYEDEHFNSFYRALSTFPPITPWKETQTAQFLCFSDAYFGVSNQTLWYQYGFLKPQGPLLSDEIVVGSNVQRAAHFLASHLYTKCFFCQTGKFLVLISRKDTRKILNEGQLIFSLAQRTKLKIMSVSLETHSLQEIISIVRLSKGVIGVHGSLLSVIMFLQPGSIVVELFPYAVNPDKYTPFRVLASLPRLRLTYKAWANPYKVKSVAHPDWPREQGGISHLTASEQRQIALQVNVPDHLCCEDPSWLFHIYQDTEVHVDQVVSLVLETLAESDKNPQPAQDLDREDVLSEDIPMSPGPVRNVTCSESIVEDKCMYILNWKPPWNVDIAGLQNCYYHLIYKSREAEHSKAVNVRGSLTQHSLPCYTSSVHESVGSTLSVWIHTVCEEDVAGYSVHASCKKIKV